MKNYNEFLTRQVRIYELALRELIKRFDYDNSPRWRSDIEKVILDIAKNLYDKELEKNNNDRG